jgi:hypothetical protein
VRTELLQQLRQLAVQQGRWHAVLRARNSSGSTAWLTACHWALPEAVDFFLMDTTFKLQDMMFATKGEGKPCTPGKRCSLASLISVRLVLWPPAVSAAVSASRWGLRPLVKTQTT